MCISVSTEFNKMELALLLFSKINITLFLNDALVEHVVGGKVVIGRSLENIFFTT